TCPGTDNGQYGTYDRKEYTSNQVQAAVMIGVDLIKRGKTIGARQFPHAYRRLERLPFPCGNDNFEFPILTNGNRYAGEPVEAIPDRVVFEVKKKGKKDYIPCGVMRHRPNAGFLLCP
ncbi:Ribonuclease/ribotoxin, partial [Byssothecium circinans]